MIEWLTEQVGYVPGGTNIGVVRTNMNSAILIDSGLNDTAVRKVLRALQGEGRPVSSIVTTHCHADHFGGNAFVVRRTGAQVHAPELDEAILRYPLLQPICLYAGADPPPSLRGGFLLAEPSPVDVIYSSGDLSVDGVEMQAISLAGHSGNQMGILIDGVFFSADVALPARVIERYRMPYLYSVRDHVDALERASVVGHRVAVPGHGPALEDLGPLLEVNRRLVDSVAAAIVEMCAIPRMPEEILAEVIIRLGASVNDPAAYYLLHPTVFAYLTFLEAASAVVHTIDAGRSLWQRL